ncbi:proteobacterial dedicated sortase system response regulator [Hydrocarboniclastica marina]|uniref:Proteobacterial dedicated sortase system response regulator n=1 Tax=Hydrocarboniclastica marina TaxID=2259620 RepID=A0A4P7XD17_9ALTE|nr:proteobacterial dedicated sortase system response regulator [Hydrocarboniclastica marina]MAL97784.1 proteobacterial dedicated sortase system response regulator [Alteromonadaceae bacterium]QCF24758.1 proteobacterial dedicated sortase system response regulator [Hydrocarboniclastica marina]
MQRRIVLVEDEPAIRANYRDALSRRGYAVDAYPDRASAWAGCRDQSPDLAIIDVGLGAEVDGGFDLCRDLRAQSPTLPIIFLTARDDETDAILGLRLGADDYVTKDMSLSHLFARIAALLRRAEAYREQAQEKDEKLQRGRLTLNLDRLTVAWCEQYLDLTITEFWMLHALAKRPGHIRSRSQLMDAANTVLDDNTVTSHIKRIRRKFEAIDPRFEAIHTLYGVGYRWDPHEAGE